MQVKFLQPKLYAVKSVQELKKLLQKSYSFFDDYIFIDEPLKTDVILKILQKHKGFQILSPFLTDGSSGIVLKDDVHRQYAYACSTLYPNRTLWNIIFVMFLTPDGNIDGMKSVLYWPFNSDVADVKHEMRTLLSLSKKRDPKVFEDHVRTLSGR